MLRKPAEMLLTAEGFEDYLFIWIINRTVDTVIIHIIYSDVIESVD